MASAAIRSEAVVLLLLIHSLLLLPLWGFCVCFLFCCAVLCGLSSFAIISMAKREPVALLCQSSWCLVTVPWLFLAGPLADLQYAVEVFP